MILVPDALPLKTDPASSSTGDRFRSSVIDCVIGVSLKLIVTYRQRKTPVSQKEDRGIKG
jgi:hypothetical protein